MVLRKTIGVAANERRDTITANVTKSISTAEPSSTGLRITILYCFYILC
jgi:hypothetical protein